MLSTLTSRFVLLAVAALTLVACSGETSATTVAEATPTTMASPSITIAPGSPLVGQWERAESTFTSLDGMIIEVQDDGGTALILTVPENEYQFQAGDEKWSDIQQTSENEYSFQDLVREENTGATSHVEGVIAVSDDGSTLVMTFPTQAPPKSGSGSTGPERRTAPTPPNPGPGLHPSVVKNPTEIVWLPLTSRASTSTS